MRQRSDGTWWSRIAHGARRLKQEPGTTSLAAEGRVADAARTREDEMSPLPDEDLAARAGLPLDPADDDQLAAHLALVAEAARRAIGRDPHPPQLVAAAALLRGRVVDMATGEGKTLVGFLAAAGLVRTGVRVHVLTANAYLAARDAEEGTPFFRLLGMTSAAVVEGMDDAARREAYGADVAFSTVPQVGFDLLRDRQRVRDADRLVPPPGAAVLDEIDAALIDEATVPLVLAGEANADPDDRRVADAVRRLVEGSDYEVDPDRRAAALTDAGIAALEEALGVPNLYADDAVDLLTAAHVALHAEALVRRDVDYVVSDGRVRLVAAARGRIADRQRWPDGLQAAIERKEGLEVTARAEVLDQILVESVVRRYPVRTGMSGSAAEAAERLAEDMGFETGVVPTQRRVIRIDEPDRLFDTARRRDEAAAREIRRAHETGQPVLVGTASVAASEGFARVLARHGLDPVVLNAKNDRQEAEVIARAGERGRITVSTQMAGRGVDILLGEGAAAAGGLLVVGIGRGDSARLDRQLRGRSGRQGDPGRSVFFTSLEDPVITENLILRGDALAGSPPDAQGRIASEGARRLYAHAQRVAEGRLMELHRTTRRYHRRTDRNRALLLRTRERILADDDALAEYLTLVWPDDPDRVREWAAPERLGLARDVALLQIDRAWTDHLGELAAVREGIHLRALGRQSPLQAYTRIEDESFRAVPTGAARATREILESAAAGDSLESLGLSRLSSTWTYMVADNPFGSQIDRVVAFASRLLRGGRPPAIGHVR
ncbi:accessory Sec system translocase SecA2 [Microbacterium sp. gxy059]|uniref:accessory Sec system translocase SecA2 n=1 Tax=Microbacterium sp. gxy059 TaxID=2957199 RepID=UPI003D99EB3D